MVQLMPVHPKNPSSLASPKCRLVLPFWYWLTQAVLEKRPLNGCNSSVVADEMVLTAKPEKLDLSIFSYKTIYTVSKKTRHQTLAHNFTKCSPIFGILSLLDSAGNL